MFLKQDSKEGCGRGEAQDRWKGWTFSRWVPKTMGLRSRTAQGWVTVRGTFSSPAPRGSGPLHTSILGSLYWFCEKEDFALIFHYESQTETFTSVRNLWGNRPYLEETDPWRSSCVWKAKDIGPGSEDPPGVLFLIFPLVWYQESYKPLRLHPPQL